MWSSGWSRSPKSDDCHDHGVGDWLTLTSDPILLRQDRADGLGTAPLSIIDASSASVPNPSCSGPSDHPKAIVGEEDTAERR